ncbi:MAG: efflux RND transporter permease subunit [Desulfobacterales bacterium]|nr:efflux RND transporter permease subunit [Desulfobacterales bacterium]
MNNIPKNEKKDISAIIQEAEAYSEHGLLDEAIALYEEALSFEKALNIAAKSAIINNIRILNRSINDPNWNPAKSLPIQKIIFEKKPIDEKNKSAYSETETAYNDNKRQEHKLSVQNVDDALLPFSLTRSIVKFSLKQTVFINVVFVLLVLFGIFAVLSSPVELLPPADTGDVIISTLYYGASADDVENLVTVKIEKAVEGLEDIEFIHSKSIRNYSIVHVKFIDDSDYRMLYDELRFKVLNVKKELPPETLDPSFYYMTTNYWISVITVNIQGNIPKQTQKLLADELKAQILSIPGVQNADLSGEFQKEFHVSLNPDKLREFGITFNQVASAIRAANTKIPTGRFKQGPSEYMLDAGNKFSKQEEVLNVIVRKVGESDFLRVRDLVTSAHVSHRDPSSISSINGEPTISLRVLKAETANAIDIAEKVKTVADEFAEAHKEDGIVITYTNDSTIEIRTSINVLRDNLIMGMVLVTLILWMTLGFRNAMITAIGIPFSFLCTFIIMKMTGLSINTINLFAFVLVSGIIVDDAIVVVENIYRHQQLGKPLKIAIIDGTSEVMLPVISSALTTILAFIPMLIMTGALGDFFSVIPKAVTYALLASLFESLIMVPLHVLDWGAKEATGIHTNIAAEENAHISTGIFGKIWGSYSKALNILLDHKLISIGVTAGLFICALLILGLSVSGAVPLMKIKFFPSNYMKYHVTMDLPNGTSIEKTDEVVKDLATYIMSLGKKQAETASGSAGFFEDEDRQWLSGSHYGQLIVTIPPLGKRDFPENPDNDAMQHIEYIRKKLNEHIDKTYADFDPSSPTGLGLKPKIKVFPENTGPPAGKPVSIRIVGSDLQTQLMVLNKLSDFLKTEPEMKDLTDLGDNRPELQKVIKYTPKQEKAYEYGLNPGIVTGMVVGALGGQKAGEFRTGEEEINLMVRLARKDDEFNVKGVGLSDPRDILDVPVIEHSASPILFRDLVRMNYVMEPDSKARYNGKPSLIISANIKDGSNLTSSRVQYLAKQYFATIMHEFPGVTLNFEGEFAATGRAYASLTAAFFIALLCIYLVLASQFGDYIQPFIILSAVGFSIMGIIYGMFFTRSIFTIGSFLAVVGLAGLTVNDCIILLEFMNQLREQGKSIREAVIGACTARMRPVLITTITTILGLLPMAIGIPNKSIEWSPMATAFVTGSAAATMMTILIVPVLYEITAKSKDYLSSKATIFNFPKFLSMRQLIKIKNFKKK